MKTIQTKAGQISVALVALLAMSSLTARASVLFKANNETALNVNTSWTTVSGSANGVNIATAAPGSGDTAYFDSTFSAANNAATLSANSTWGTLIVSNTINAAYTLTLANPGNLQVNAFTMADACPFGFTIAPGNNFIPGSGPTFTVGSGDTLTISANMAPAGAFTFVGSANAQSSGNYGTVNLSGISGSWSAALNVGNGAILKVGNSGGFNGNPSVTTLSGGVIDMNGISFSGGLVFSLNGNGQNGMGAIVNSSSSTATKSGGSWALIANATVGVFNGTIVNSVNFTGAHTLTKVGPGLLSMGTGTGEGFNGLVINAGSVSFSQNTALPTSVTPVVNGGSLDLNGSTYPQAMNLAGFGTAGTGALINSSTTGFNWQNSANAITLNGDAGIGGNGTGGLTLSMNGNSGVIGSGALYKLGSCTLMLNGNQATKETYSGATVVNGGTLILNYNGSSTSLSNLVPNTPLCFGSNYLGAGVLAMIGKSGQTFGQAFNNTYLVSGGGGVSNVLNGTATTMAFGNITRNTGGGTIDFSANINSAATAKTTTTANNSAGILGGWATWGNGVDYAYGTGSSPYIISNYTGGTALPTTATSAGTANYTSSGTTMGGNVTANSLQVSGGTLALSTFNLTLAGGNSGASGGLLVSASTTATTGGGVISAGSGNELVVYTAPGATLSTPGAALIGANNGTLTKSGAGTLSITTSSAPYTGVTTINQGTVSLASGISISNSIIIDGGATLSLAAATVFTNQDLAGNGTIGGALATMGAGGTIHPGGNGQWGTINFGAGLTEGSTSTNFFDLYASNGQGPSDQIAVTGTLTCGGAKIVIVPGTGFTNGQYVLANATTAVSGTFNSTVTCTSGTGTFTLSYPTTTNVLLTVSGYNPCTSPNAYQVTGGTNCSTSGVSVGLSGSDTFVTYGLFTNGVADGAGVVGTGSALTPGAWAGLSGVGTYTVVGTNTTGGCTTTMTGNAVVTQAATNTTYNLTGGTNGCSGTGLTIGLSSSQSGVTYQLVTNSVVITSVAGTGSAISFGTYTNPATYTVQATNIGCGTTQISGGATNQVVIAATPGAPTSPAAAAGNGVITNSWTAPSGTVPTSYNIYRGTNGPGSESATPFANVSASPFIDTSVIDGSNYVYKITSLNGTCESAASGEVSGTPNPAYTAYVITDAGFGNAQAGVSDSLTINAVNNGSPVSIGGTISLTFTGLNGLTNAPGGTAPTLGGTAFSAGSVTKTVTFSGGAGTIALVAYNAGSGQTLTASDGTHSSTNTAGGGTNLSLTVSAAASSAYRLTGIGSPTVGSNYVVNVTLVDAYQNVETGTNASQNLAFNGSLTAGANGSAASINGVAQGTAAAVSLVNGTNSVILVAHFPDTTGKVITVTNTALTLASYGTGGANLTLAAVTNAAASQLSMKTQPPATAAAGATLAASAVNVLDLYSNLLGSSATISAGAGGGDILQGTTNVAASGGVATFGSLSLTNTGSIALTFTYSNLFSVTSSNITVSGGAFAGLAWITQPVAIYGSPFTTPPVLAAVDQYGNPTTNGLVAGMNVTISMTGHGTLSGTTSYDIGSDGSNGVVTLNNLVVTNGSGSGNTLTASLPAGYGSPVTGMAIWLDGSVASSVVGTAPVTRWNDLSGNNYNFATTSGSASQITYANTINGRHVVTFPSGGTSLITTNNSYVNTTPNMTLFTLVRHAAGTWASYEGPVSSITSGGADWNQVGCWSIDARNVSPNGQPSSQRNQADIQTSTTVAANTPFIWYSADSSANNLEYVGYETATATNSASTAWTSQNFNVSQVGVGGRFSGVGSGTGAGVWNGDIGEVLIYNSYLTPAQQTNIYTYLYNKWLNTSGSAVTLGPLSATTASFTVTPATVTILSGVTANSKVYDGGTVAMLTFGTIVLSNVVVSDAGNVSLNSSSYTANFTSSSPGTWPVTVTGLTLMGSANTNYTLAQPANLTASITANAPYNAYTITDSGGGSATVGVADTLTITAVTNGLVQTNLNGNVVVAFSGLNNGADGSLPTVTDYTGNPAPYNNTTLFFTNGVATNTLEGGLVPHVAQTGATLQVIDIAGNSSTNTAGGGVPLSLNVAPAGISAYRLTGTGSPQVGVNYTVNVAMVDQYQNVITNGLSSVGLTFNPTPTLSPGADGSVATINGVAQNTSAAVGFSAGLGSVLLVAHTNDVSGKVISVTDGSKSSSSTGGTALTLGAITQGAAFELSVKTQPSATASVGVAFAQQPAVNVLDLYSNLLTGSSATVTATASAGILQGGSATNQAASSGVATFSGLSMTNTGTITLTFSSGVLTPATSTSITVGAGAMTQLGWTTQPGSGSSIYATAFGTQPVLAAEDQYGNPTTNGLPSSMVVTVSQTSGAGKLIGTTNYNLGSSYSNGLATCTGLGVAGTGNNMQLTATAQAGYGTPPVAGAAIWLDASYAPSILLNGSGVVTNWLDRSGSNNNFINLSATSIYYTNNNSTFSGLKTVTFGGATELFNTTYTNTSVNVSVFVVFKETTGANFDYMRPMATWAGNTSDADYQNNGSFNYDTGAANNQARAVRNESPNGDITGPTVNWQTNYFDDEFLANSSSNVLFVNGNFGASNTGGVGAFNIVATSVGGGIAAGGAGNNNGQLNGDVAEMLVYSSALSTANRQSVESYLYNKWNTTNYPYQTAPTAAVSTTFTVSQAGVTITNVTAANKTYDGTTTAALSTGAAGISGALNGDTVTYTAGTGAFASPYVGTWTVTASGFALTTSGVSTNYSLTAQPVVPNANISQAGVTITNVTAASKTYDATTTAILSGGGVSGAVNGDNIATSFTAGTGAFAGKDEGTQAVTASGYALTTSGIITNYMLSAQPAVPNATISAKALTAQGTLGANNKCYDGTTAATLTGTAALVSPADAPGGGSSGDGTPYSGDTVSLAGSPTGTFVSSSVGTAIAVDVTGLSLNNNGAGDYTLTAPVLSASIYALPTVTGQPSNSTNCVGDTASFTVTTSDASDVYQWFTNGVALTNGPTGNGSTIGGATNSTLAYTSVQAADAVTNIYCVLTTTNGCNITTTNVSLTVNPLPTTSAISGSSSVSLDQAGVTYSVTDTSGSSYAWTVPGDATITAGNTGPDNNQITVTFGSTSGNVSVVETNASGCTGTQQNLFVTVSSCTGPAIVGGISGQTNLCVGSPLVLTLTNVTGTTPFSYQWQTNNVAIVGGTNSAYTNLTVAVTDGGNYVCVVTNACGSITSVVATVTVNPPPTVSVNSVTNCGTVSSILTATSSASSPTYLWSDGETTASITNSSPAVTTNYTVMVTDGVTGCTGTGSGAIVVNPNPNATITVGTVYHNSTNNSASVESGDATYVWGISNGIITAGSGTDTITFTAGASGTLILTNTVTTSAGCSDTETASVVLTNHPPVAGDATYYRPKGNRLTIPLSNLFTNVTDADGDTNFTVTAVGTGTNSATITAEGAYIYYFPCTCASSNYNDSFTYTVSDNYPGDPLTATGNIIVDVYSAAGQAQMGIPTNFVVNIKFWGIPDHTYIVNTATNITFVPTWPLSTNMPGSDGSWIFTDTNATNAQQYYRLTQP